MLRNIQEGDFYLGKLYSVVVAEDNRTDGLVFIFRDKKMRRRATFQEHYLVSEYIKFVKRVLRGRKKRESFDLLNIDIIDFFDYVVKTIWGDLDDKN